MTKQDRTRKVLDNWPDLNLFLKQCCKSRHYLFSIRKCRQQLICRPLQLSIVFRSLHYLPDPLHL